MDHVAGVEIAEAFSDIGQLARGKNVAQRSTRGTHETDSIRISMVPDVSRQITARHPIRNELEGFDGHTKKGDDVWMCQVFPHHGHLAKSLRVRQHLEIGKPGVKTHLLDLLRITLGVRPDTFHAKRT